MIRITDSDGDQFDVPDGWDGAVGDHGDMLLNFPARDWKVGQWVRCLLKIEGKLQPVQFKVAKVVKVEKVGG